MAQNAAKQGKLDSFSAIFLFICLPGIWGLGFQNYPSVQGKETLNPKTTHPNKKSLRKQFSELFVQIVLPLSFQLNRRHAERVSANCLRKLFSVGLWDGWYFEVGFFPLMLVVVIAIIFFQEEMLYTPLSPHFWP